jgi:hypothetical protein
MPGLAKCGRRADTSGVRPAEDFGGLDEEIREDPELSGGRGGRFPGSRKGTGTGMMQEGGVDGEG